MQGSRVEHPAELDEHPLDAVRSGLEQVEGLIPDAAVGAGDGVGVADVGLAHLEEGAAAGEQPQRRVDEFARQRVEYDVDAAAAGDGEELLLELGGAGVADVVVVESHGAQRVPLGLAGGDEDVQPPQPGQLNGCHADTAGGGVDEDRLPRPHRGQLAQGVERGGEDHGDGGGVGVAPALGDGPMSSRASVTASEPVPSGNSPMTRSPVTRSVTPEPVSMTTPAASVPSTASPGYMPSVIMTSRKFAAIASTCTRTWLGANGFAASSMVSSTRLSKVPASVIASRHGRSSGGGDQQALRSTARGDASDVHGAAADRGLGLARRHRLGDGVGVEFARRCREG